MIKHAFLLLALAFASSPSICFGQKTDVLYLVNGDEMTGEIRRFDLGQVEFRTHSMGTVYVRFETVSTLNSDKSFEIEYLSGERVIGEVRSSNSGYVSVFVDADTTVVPTQTIVKLSRTKPRFWRGCRPTVRTAGKMKPKILQERRRFSLSRASSSRTGFTRRSWAETRVHSSVWTIVPHSALEEEGIW